MKKRQEGFNALLVRGRKTLMQKGVGVVTVKINITLFNNQGELTKKIESTQNQNQTKRRAKMETTIEDKVELPKVTRTGNERFYERFKHAEQLGYQWKYQPPTRKEKLNHQYEYGTD